jgi:hypothetical protein
MEFAHGDDLYVAYFNEGAIVRVTPEGDHSVFVAGLDVPFGVTFRDDMLHVGDNLGNGNGPGIIYEINASGDKTDAIAPVPGRIVDLKSNDHPGFEGLFVANQVTGTVQRVLGAEIAEFATGFDGYPRALAVGPGGGLYVTDASSLYRITVIPEPSSCVLFCLGALVALGGGRLAGVRAPRHVAPRPTGRTAVRR